MHAGSANLRRSLFCWKSNLIMDTLFLPAWLLVLLLDGSGDSGLQAYIITLN